MDDILKRRVANILPKAAALQQLMAERPIRAYLGIDPTGGRLHIGHAIGIKKLMEFAKAGHEAILLFGTGTVLVGDPSQRDTARQTITPEEIEKNITGWKDQVAPIIDFNKVQIKQNGEWINKLGLTEIINIASHISAVQLFKRDNFERRLAQGDTVWYHETMYPLLQGYDSVVLDVDLEIGGTDQEFNMLIGRELQRKMKQREKFVLTTPMINGIDGQPMSKTTGNCVWLNDEPAEMFGKLMSVPDDQIIPYLELCTDVAQDEINSLAEQIKTGVNPKDVKTRMALEITKIWHDSETADRAQVSWQEQFGQGQLPGEIPEYKVDKTDWALDELLVTTGLASSKSEARRLIEQGGVRLNQIVIKDMHVNVNPDDVLQAGKRRFVRVVEDT